MALTKDELIEHFVGMRAALLAAVGGLSDELLSEPSLDGWSVKDHLAHIALWDEVRASEVERISAGQDSVWRMAGDEDGILSGLAYKLRRDISPAQALWEVSATHARLLEAIRASSERGLDSSLYGEAALHSTHEAAHTAWILRWRGERGL